MKRILACLAGVAMLASASAAHADRAIIVLDASGSMWGQIDGEAKISIARDTLAKVLKTVPPELELGLMAYGHRDKGSCTDIELVVPPAAGTADAIAAAASKIQPKGKTPLSEAVRRAAEDLRYTEDKATVILITDGLETCDADSCAVANELENAGVDFTAHVVGFGLSSEEGRQVACLAENTGGKYIAAGNAEALGQALTETVVVAEPAPEAVAPEYNLLVTARIAPEAEPFSWDDNIRYDVHQATADGFGGDPVGIEYGHEGSLAKFGLPAGDYVIVASKDLARATLPVSVSADEETTVDVVFDAGFIEARAMDTETTPSTDDGVRWDITDSTGETDISYGPTRRILVDSGESTVTASLGNARATVPVTVNTGETVAVDVVIGSGQLVLRGKRSEEANDLDDAIAWQVTDAAGETTTVYGGEVTLDLAAGDYTVTATLGQASVTLPVSIPAGKTVEKTVVVATGRAVAHLYFGEGGPMANDGTAFEVVDSDPGSDGEYRVVTYGYGDGVTFDLPPGKYVMRGSIDIAKAESGFEVSAAKVTEVPVIVEAGILAITAPGAEALELFKAEKNIMGERESVAYAYGESWTLAAPSGDYVLKVSKGGSEATYPVSVRTGERTELLAN